MRYLPFFVALIPLASSFITYIFVSNQNNFLALDSTQAALVTLGLLKMVLLGSTGVFPIDMNDVFKRVLGKRKKRDVDSTAMNSLHYQPLEVEDLPCVTRFMCELETTIKTSDSYLPEPSKNMEGRHPEEEVDVEPADPLTELYIEAISAMYRTDEKKDVDFTEKSEKALNAIQSLTGPSCEKAYKLCPGRYPAAKAFRKVFEEIGFKARDEL